MSSSCIHMPSTPGEKKRLRSWYAVIADKCAFPRTDSYAVTAKDQMLLETFFLNAYTVRGNDLTLLSKSMKLNRYQRVATSFGSNRLRRSKSRQTETGRVIKQKLKVNWVFQVTMGATRCSECPPENGCLGSLSRCVAHDAKLVLSTVLGALTSSIIALREVMRLGAMNKYRTRLGLCKLVSWNPTDADIKAWDMMTRVGHHAQLRGLLNMGSTCYMNSVLQALVHTPVLRDYFLSDQHCCQRPAGTCLMCTMHQLMQDFHRGDSSDPVAPSDVLHIVWEQSQMSMGGQQDAHEFFLAVHDLLHRHYNAPFSSSPVTETDSCKCIVHQTFTGKLRSDIICNKCSSWSHDTCFDNRSVSSSTQPFLDVSLIVPATSPADQIGIKTCLEMFCAREDLDRNCERCGCMRATRRMSFKVLPSVIVFHLKRFSPSATGKNSTVVWFDLESDMSPFTSAFLDNPSLFDPRTSAGMISHKNHSYSLFAIVTHIGDSSGAGHYISYVRRNQNKWYRCDDHQIKEVHYSDVVMTEAYLLFYQLTQLRLK
ncbi:ubiquitinyl hydrolase 1 [Ostertagia ostertagi]